MNRDSLPALLLSIDRVGLSSKRYTLPECLATKLDRSSRAWDKYMKRIDILSTVNCFVEDELSSIFCNLCVVNYRVLEKR